MSRAGAMARLAAGMLALALALAGSAAAEPAMPGLNPGLLAAAPLPQMKPDRSAGAPAAGLIASIDFAPQATELTPAGEERLQELARQLRHEPAAPFAIVAYARESGSAMSARRISLGRALAVRAFLIERGIGRGRMSVKAQEAPPGQGGAERVDILWPPR
jgi:outer membrane protein OmpA-like peptidoglycan-associated protein